MARDPQYPDRPDHADFRRLSRIVVDNDTRSEAAGVDNFETLVAGTVDPESLIYMAQQRVMRQMGTGYSPDFMVKVLSLYLDAFMLGAGFAQSEPPGGEPVDKSAILSRRLAEFEAELEAARKNA